MKERIDRRPRDCRHRRPGEPLDQRPVVVLVLAQLRLVARPQSVDDDGGYRLRERGACRVRFPFLADRGFLAEVAVAGDERVRREAGEDDGV
ncbi:hypothetical protein C490_06939 [Natronobacterium gregoryi SP2]|uniref:Uncharacterized protein n=1 Tax=Natronobacterium gregoryi (strain ATCC 43098 / DSM 3393 / CCM 3738 / CIP 104747 / IAM 13177 / JCM 8860 / NBRC 102187 / NCIMB 2189 / SP2) TaxID=797304 RepID=L9Y7P3_NATGS|nr:hypothetical protein C490_06939 [Natronobacterium gregoryi SP2]